MFTKLGQGYNEFIFQSEKSEISSKAKNYNHNFFKKNYIYILNFEYSCENLTSILCIRNTLLIKIIVL